ncbi:MAG: RluA family pseudouridine synthase [Chromatiaceae bacterium]|nr:RluA family pseudouridine synthase [Chromatiaceae bacterium]MBP8290211.1 RluA family pseudouridine synthase [Chromatiaceae bacterium]MBP9602944.1 RluA family pseudouridine synthase [Chromatiaceae bacterium]
MPDEAPNQAVVLVGIDAELAGQRIDNFLLARAKGVPRSHVYRILRRGEVRVNKGRVKPDYRLQSGDLVRIPPLRMVEPRPPGQAPESRLRGLAGAILYEDERLLALDKPAGLAVHGGSGLSFGLIEAMRQMRPGAELELVHRLDRDTSGCLLLAKRASTLRDLHRLIRENGVEKRYLALLVRPLPRPEMTVDAPLLKNTLKSGERVVRVDNAQGKPARTLFRRLRRLGDLDLVEARLITGRTHQIRVHAAYLGAPLAGDEKYGDEAANKGLRPLGLRRLFLHAASLGLQPAHLDQPLRIQAPLPAELEALIGRLEGIKK